MRRILWSAALASGIVALIAPAAGASSRQRYSETFTTTRPGAPSGAFLKVDWLGNHHGEKPHTIIDDIFKLAPGARFDFSVPAICRATDAQLERKGPSACPRASKVAYGEVDLDIGETVWVIPRIIKTRLTTFDGGPGKLISLAETTNIGITIRTVDRSTVRGTAITTKNPDLPGFPPPDAFVAVKADRIHFLSIAKGAGKSRRGFLTTPPRCPAGGAWINTATFRYHDRVTTHASSRSRCTT
jgi:hypothetical protein